VVVLARELNLEQVAEIYRRIREENICGPSGEQVRIEMFCHGALCMAISGKCYLSLNELGASANRGACMQVCRRGYIVKDRESDIELAVENQYIMSPKDLKTIRFMDRMIEAGVRVFKIEGRARGPEYVRTVTECYSEAIDAWLKGEFTDEKKDDWDRRLATVFNRGFWDGYYMGKRLGEWNDRYGSQATETKVYVGKCTNWFSRLSVGEFLIEAAEINAGDKLMVTGNATGCITFALVDPRVDLESVEAVPQGVAVSFRTPEKVRRGDKLYKIVPRLWEES
jgi:putative protease